MSHYSSGAGYRGAGARERARGASKKNTVVIKSLPGVEQSALSMIFDEMNGPQWTKSTGWNDRNATVVLGANVHHGHVVDIRLPQNNVSGSVPSEISCFKMLATLQLKGNRLTGGIPVDVCACANLKMLDLSNNQLSGALPSELGQLRQLRWLHLSGNQLSGGIPAALGQCQSLVKLHLQSNQLEGEIPAALSQLQSLVELNVAKNRLYGPLPTELEECAALNILIVDENKLAGKIPLGLLQLQTLSFKGNRSLIDPKVQAVPIYKSEVLSSFEDYFVLLTGCTLGYVDIVSDYLACVRFIGNGRFLEFYASAIFIAMPACVGARNARSKRDKVLSLIQLRLLWETYKSWRHGHETTAYGTLKFVEASLESIPQMLLQSWVLLSIWDTSEFSIVIPFSLLASFMSLGAVQIKVFDRSVLPDGWDTTVFGYVMLMTYHLSELIFRVIPLVIGAFMFNVYVTVFMAAIVLVRVALKIRSHSENVTLLMAGVALVMDSVWDARRDHIRAQIATGVECFFMLLLMVTVDAEAVGDALGYEPDRITGDEKYFLILTCLVALTVKVVLGETVHFTVHYRADPERFGFRLLAKKVRESIPGRDLEGHDGDDDDLYDDDIESESKSSVVRSPVNSHARPTRQRQSMARRVSTLILGGGGSSEPMPPPDVDFTTAVTSEEDRPEQPEVVTHAKTIDPIVMDNPLLALGRVTGSSPPSPATSPEPVEARARKQPSQEDLSLGPPASSSAASGPPAGAAANGPPPGPPAGAAANAPPPGPPAGAAANAPPPGPPAGAAANALPPPGAPPPGPPPPGARASIVPPPSAPSGPPPPTARKSVVMMPGPPPAMPPPGPPPAAAVPGPPPPAAAVPGPPAVTAAKVTRVNMAPSTVSARTE